MAFDKSESTCSRAVAIAGKCVGIVENPKDSNRGKLIDTIQGTFGMVGQQYCGMFAVWCYDVALHEVGYTIGKGLRLAGPSSQSLFEYAKTLGCTYTTNPLPGDIVIWRKFKLWQGHVGIVAGGVGSSIITIEGNTSPGVGLGAGDAESQRNGGGIYKKVRGIGKLDWAEDAFYLRGFIDMRKLLSKDGVVCSI